MYCLWLFLFIFPFRSLLMEVSFVLCLVKTYTGSILIAVNPFTKLPHLYNVHMMEQYKGAPFGELDPHVFAVADASYRYLLIKHNLFCILYRLLITYL